MKRTFLTKLSLLFVFVAILCTTSCEDAEILGSEFFYENYSVDRFTLITADREVYLEGGQPLVFEVEAEQTIRSAGDGNLIAEIITLQNVDITYEVDGVAIDGNTFTPTSTGTIEVAATAANGVSSSLLLVESILAQDFGSSIGFSDRFISITAPQSSFQVGEIIDIDLELNEDFVSQGFASDQVNIIANDGVFTASSFSLSEPGEFSVYAQHSSGLTSNMISIQIRS